MVKLTKPRAILLDIEGTTTSVKFFKDTLVPHVKSTIGKYLKKRFEKPEVETIIKDLRKECRARHEEDENLPLIASSKEDDSVVIKSVVKYVNYSLDKGGALSHEMQNLFVLLWVYGYEEGELKGHVYRDVATALEAWYKKKIKIYILSTGKADVQKLLFANSSHGTLITFIKEFFDANDLAGKKDTKTYKAIAQIIGVDTEDMLFLTDNVKEAKAAAKADVMTILVSRPENKPIPESVVESEEFRIIESFEEIVFK